MTTRLLLPDLPDLCRGIADIPRREPDVLATAPSALVAHDNPDVRHLLRGVLTERLGISDVIEASCLDVAIELLAATHGIALVIISLELQGVEPGMTVCLLRRHFPGIRVVVASSRRDRLAALRPLAAGAHGHIDIGTTAEDLAEALELIRRGRVAVPSWLPDFQCEDD